MESLAMLVGLIAVGFAARRAGWLSDAYAEVLPAVLMKLCYPAMILCNIGGMGLDGLAAFSRIAAATVVITLLIFFISKAALRSQGPDRQPVLRFELCVGNVSFVVIPLLTLWGYETMTAGMLVHGTVQDLFIWMLVFPLFARREGSWWKTLLNPCLVAFFFALVLAIFNLRLPAVLLVPLEALQGMTTPLALLFLGATIARFGAFRWLHSRAAMLFSAIKVIAMPVLVYFGCRLFLNHTDSLVLACAFGAPTPLMTVIWSASYKKDVAFATDCCILSTILYIVIFTCLHFLRII